MWHFAFTNWIVSREVPKFLIRAGVVKDKRQQDMKVPFCGLGPGSYSCFYITVYFIFCVIFTWSAV
jgi:hypothetical protein